MRVLVVEDEIRMAVLLKRALEEEGHAVDVVGDGPEGLWMATENGIRNPLFPPPARCLSRRGRWCCSFRFRMNGPRSAS